MKKSLLSPLFSKRKEREVGSPASSGPSPSPSRFFGKGDKSRPQQLGSDGLFFASSAQVSAWLTLALGKEVRCSLPARELLRLASDQAELRRATGLKDAELRACALLQRIADDKAAQLAKAEAETGSFVVPPKLPEELLQEHLGAAEEEEVDYSWVSSSTHTLETYNETANEELEHMMNDIYLGVDDAKLEPHESDDLAPPSEEAPLPPPRVPSPPPRRK